VNRLRPHLTYANVIATLALFLALGGGAYAAIKLPKNSVGAKQIKKNAVRSAEIKGNAVGSGKVKNRSLRANDFKAGQLPRGPQGPQGFRGPVGPTYGSSHGGTGTPAQAKPYDRPVVASALKYTFKTPARGRLLVAATNKTMSVDCSGGGAAYIFVTLDGTAIPGTQKESTTGTPYVTSAVTGLVAAGTHTLAVAANCPGPQSINGFSYSPDGDLSAVLIGG
jgi:hypothetical protein